MKRNMLVAGLTIAAVWIAVACSDNMTNAIAPEEGLALAGKGSGKGGGVGVATIALGGGYGTAADQVVGFSKKGKEITFNAGTSNKIEYTLDLPPYGGDAVCVSSSSLPAGQTAEEFWNEFVTTQNDITLRSFLFNFRLDEKIQENRTEGSYSSGETGRARIFKAGTTEDLGLNVSATIQPSTDAGGNDVYTLTGGALQLRTVVAPGGETEGSVTCPNSRSFILTVKP